MRNLLFTLITFIAITGCNKNDDDNTIILQQDTSLSKGLIAYYPFTGNTNDASGNGNNAQAMGATLITDRNSQINSAYHFDGNDFISLINGLDTLQREISISMWIRKTGTWDANYHKFLTIGNKTAGSVYVSEGPDPYFLYFSLKDSSYEYFAYCHAPSASAWHHITAVYDGSFMKLYVDTVMKCNSSCNLDIKVKAPLYIGWGFDTEYFTGDIDDVRIYNRVLAESEISQLFFKEN